MLMKDQRGHTHTLPKIGFLTWEIFIMILGDTVANCDVSVKGTLKDIVL